MTRLAHLAPYAAETQEKVIVGVCEKLLMSQTWVQTLSDLPRAKASVSIVVCGMPLVSSRVQPLTAVILTMRSVGQEPVVPWET